MDGGDSGLETNIIRINSIGAPLGGEPERIQSKDENRGKGVLPDHRALGLVPFKMVFL